MRVPKKLVGLLSRNPDALVPMEPLGKTHPYYCLFEARILVWEGFPPLEARDKALAYLAWGSLSAAKREETVSLLPSTDVETLATWFYEHREEPYCWWRTRYKKGKPRMKVDYFGSSTGTSLGWGISRWVVNVKDPKDIDRVQRAASRKYAELILEWLDDPERAEYLRLVKEANER